MSKLKETLNNFKNILSADDKVKAVTEMPVVMADAVAQDQVTDKDEEDKMKDVKKDVDEFVKDYENKDRKTFKASKEMKNLKLGESKLNEEADTIDGKKIGDVFNNKKPIYLGLINEYYDPLDFDSRKDMVEAAKTDGLLVTGNKLYIPANSKLTVVEMSDGSLGVEYHDYYYHIDEQFLTPINETIKYPNSMEESLEIRVENGKVYGPGGRLTKSFINMIDKKAKKVYKEKDDFAFYGFTDDALAILWATCMMSKENPFGKPYDDEAYEAIADRPNSKEIFDMADKIYDAFFTPLEPLEESTRSAKVYNPYNYTIQELRIDDDAKTFERGDFTMGKADRKFRNRQEYEDFVDKLKKDGYTEIKSDYKSLRNKTRKGIPTMESVKMNKKLTLDESLFTDYKKHSKVFKESVLNKRRKSLNESKKTLKESIDVSDVRYAEDVATGEEWVVKPIWRNERLATIYKEDNEDDQTRIQVADLFDSYVLYDEDHTVISEPSLDESLKEEKNPLEGIRSNTLEFPNGEYMYIGYEDGKLYAGGATNAGIFHEYEIDYDEDDSVDGNIERLYDTIIEEKPELLEEGCGKKSLKEAKKKSGYDVYTLVYDCLIGGLKDDEKRPNIAETDKRVKVDDFVATKNDDVVIKTEDPEVIAYVNKIADILNLPVKEGEGTIGIELNAKTSEMPIEDFIEEMGIETPIKYVNVQYERRKAEKAAKEKDESLKEARSTVADEDAVRELVLYAENDSRIYHRSIQPIIANMQRKISKGVFDEEKAVRAFQYAADEAAKQYKRDFEPDEDGTYDYEFNAATRREAAKELFDRYKEEIGLE